MSETKFTKVNDSGARQEFATGSVRDLADGKGRFDLIPPYPLQRLAEHYENGAKKYGDRNWEKGQPVMRYLDSALRHMIKGLLAGDQSEDHASAVEWNIMSYVHTLNEVAAGRLPAELDNRPPHMKLAPKPGLGGTIQLSSGAGGSNPGKASDMQYANLKRGFVAHVSAWKKGGCAWCGNTNRDGLLYYCLRCSDSIIRISDYPGNIFNDIAVAVGAESVSK